MNQETYEPPEDIEALIKKLQDSEEEQLIFEETCKKSLLREYYMKRVIPVTPDFDAPQR
jgi:hypothetical protein